MVDFILDVCSILRIFAVALTAIVVGGSVIWFGAALAYSIVTAVMAR
jgi:hypothetical protein